MNALVSTLALIVACTATSASKLNSKETFANHLFQKNRVKQISLLSSTPMIDTVAPSTATVPVNAKDKDVLLEALPSQCARGGDSKIMPNQQQFASSYSSIYHNTKDIFALSRAEVLWNGLQIVVFLATTWLVICSPSIANWFTDSLFRPFPYVSMHDYEVLSLTNWIIHYSALAYGISVIRWLMGKEGHANSSSSNIISNHHQKTRVGYAIACTGAGQLFGMSYMIDHALVGTKPSRAAAMQAFHNFSYFLTQASSMSIGLILLVSSYSPSIASILFALIAVAVLQGHLSFSNIAGIVVLTIGSVAVFGSSAFPTGFKSGHLMLSLMPVVITILDKNCVGGAGTDFAHSLGALWVSLALLVQRQALKNETQKVP